jgi:queuine/archaeosine tRNA-ribosyltransferase
MKGWGSFLTPTVMPIYLGATMDENPLDVEPIVIFTATYALNIHQGREPLELDSVVIA